MKILWHGGASWKTPILAPPVTAWGIPGTPWHPRISTGEDREGVLAKNTPFIEGASREKFCPWNHQNLSFLFHFCCKNGYLKITSKYPHNIVHLRQFYANLYQFFENFYKISKIGTFGAQIWFYRGHQIVIGGQYRGRQNERVGHFFAAP